MRTYLDLFWAFCKVGALTFGGGYAMLPILQREVVEQRHWATEAEVMDYYAISQCLPGIIAVNTAIFIGHKIKKSVGGIVAGLGVAFPSIVIITVIAAFISNFSHLPLVINAFAGIRVCVTVLIVNAILKLRKGAIIDIVTGVIAALVCLASIFLDVTPIVYVVVAGLAGILLSGRKGATA